MHSNFRSSFCLFGRNIAPAGRPTPFCCNFVPSSHVARYVVNVCATHCTKSRLSLFVHHHTTPQEGTHLSRHGHPRCVAFIPGLGVYHAGFMPLMHECTMTPWLCVVLVMATLRSHSPPRLREWCRQRKGVSISNQPTINRS
jgi:hypothetical protein